MCGFSAILCSDKYKDLDLLRKIENDLYHRGPDSGNIISEKGIALVFRRLSIIDETYLSDQPLYDETKQYLIVFNGEIYNYKKLKNQLEQQGCLFKSEGDTEVILQGYIKLGLKIFNLIEGMFSIVIIDKKKKKAFAVRDPLGIKPLYISYLNPGIALSSEIKPLRRLVGTYLDLTALPELLTFRYAAGDKSNYKNIKKVMAGSMIEIDLESSKVKESNYENILNSFDMDNKIDEESFIAKIKDNLIKSCKLHLQSDVGYTLQLSGGVDSSLITAITSNLTSKKLKTFSIKLEDSDHDEETWRKLVIKKYNLDHNEIFLNSNDFANALPDAIKAMEGPSPHFGCVMLMLLCKEISKNNKVVLTGEGADELFGGYDRYKVWKNLKKIGYISNLFPLVFWDQFKRYEGFKKFHRRNPAIWSSCYHNFLNINKIFPNFDFVSGYRKDIANQFTDFRTKMMAVDQKVYLDSLLSRQDKMAMASSVEARVPFCHLPLFKLINKMPHKLRIPGGDTKPILKKIAEDYLPKELIYRRKKGLTLPLDNWLKEKKGFGRYLNLFLSKDCQLGEFGNKKLLVKSVEDFKLGKNDNLPSFPILINVELWLRSLSDPI